MGQKGRPAAGAGPAHVPANGVLMGLNGASAVGPSSQGPTIRYDSKRTPGMTPASMEASASANRNGILSTASAAHVGPPVAHPSAAGGPVADGHGSAPPGANGVAAHAPQQPVVPNHATAHGPPPGGAHVAPQGAGPPEPQGPEALLQRAAKIRVLWSLCSKAYSEPALEPRRGKAHHDILLLEAKWLATDMGQERLWRDAQCMLCASAAANVQWWRRLRETERGRLEFRASSVDFWTRESAAAEAEAALKERSQSGRAAGPSGSNHVTPQANGAVADWMASLYYSAPNGLQACVDRVLENMIVQEEVTEAMRLRDYGTCYEESKRAVAYNKFRGQNAAYNAQTQVEFGIEDAEDMFGGGVKRAEARAKRNKRKVEPYDEYEPPVYPPMRDRRISGPSRKVLGSLAGSRPPSAGDLRGLDTGLESRRPVKRPRKMLDDYDFEEEDLKNNGRGARNAPPTKRQGAMLQKQNDNKRIKGQPSSKAPDRLAGMASQGIRQGGRGQLPQLEDYPTDRDQLLTAVVHEFGSCWRLVADVMNSSLQVRGICVSETYCKMRFRDIAAREKLAEGATHEGFHAPNMISKSDARILLNEALPCPGADMAAHARALINVAHRHRVFQEKNRHDAAQVTRVAQHHTQIQAQGYQLTGLSERTPQELLRIIEQTPDVVPPGQLVAQMPPPIVPPHMGGPPHPGPQHPPGPLPGPSAHPGGAPGVSPQPHPMNPGGGPPQGAMPMPQPAYPHTQSVMPPPGSMHGPGMMPQPGIMQPTMAMGPPGGPLGMPLPQPGVGAPRHPSAGPPGQVPPSMQMPLPMQMPGGIPGPGQMAGGMPPQQSQQQQLPSPGGLPPQPMTVAGMAPPQMGAQAVGGMPPGAVSGGYPMMTGPGPGGSMPQQPGHPPPGMHPQQQQQQQRGLSAAQIQHVLNTGVLPNGQVITPQYRDQLAQQLNSMRMQAQAHQAQAHAQAQGHPGQAQSQAPPPTQNPGMMGTQQVPASAAQVQAMQQAQAAARSHAVAVSQQQQQQAQQGGQAQMGGHAMGPPQGMRPAPAYVMAPAGVMAPGGMPVQLPGMITGLPPGMPTQAGMPVMPGMMGGMPQQQPLMHGQAKPPGTT